MLVGDAGKLFNVENLQCGVGDCFAEQCLGVRTESGGDFFFGCIRIDKSHVDTQLLHGYAKQVERSAVNGGRTYKVVACLADVEDGIEIRCLSAGCQHGGYASFKGGYLGGNGIVRGVLQAGVEITAVLKVEQACHLFAGVVFESRTLINGEYTRFALFRSPPCLYAQCLRLELLCHNAICF